MSIPLFIAAGFGLTAAASPGAFQIYLISQTLKGGWRKGLPVAFAPLISDPPIVILIVLILRQVPSSFLKWVNILGGGFILYLAVNLARGWWQSAQHTENTIPAGNEEESASSTSSRVVQQSSLSILWRAALINLLSPGPYTFWSLVMGPLLIETLQDSIWLGFGVLLAFYSLFIGGLVMLVGFFHWARNLGENVVRALTLLSIVILALLGILLVFRGLVQV